ncbi:MAG: Methyltransferase type 11 [Candidatus Woesebacteria bacterium GW2011_GWA1_39_8]|uniref:Methyltransferase type 11 n=1 Tax=Candidatus Woesebacteria bacterium GW2011_GWA1_39_8 TaxID=1618552 RepID=A0A0G0PXC0_9BACT|nr:MAG: Methyltransferase type 11 [Candidatus Woesebacteria bacterium GW2011_GWA1_39_8]
MQETFNSQINNLTEIPQKRDAFKKLSFKKNWPFFDVRGGKAYFVRQANLGFDEKNNDVFVNKIKLLIKANPWLFFIIERLVGSSFLGKSASDAIKNIPEGDVILNLGSGVSVVREDVINVDFHPFENVNFVADIMNLPFADNTTDAVICEEVLEHVKDPKAVVSEMYRVMKPGALVYVVVPFVFSFHSSPSDYYRWSKMGLKELMNDFDEIDCGMRSGGGAALSWVLAEFMATILSFGLKKAHQILFMAFLVLFAPLCYLDYIFHKFPLSENIAATFYYIGRKK